MREEPEVFRAGEGTMKLTIDTVVHISCIRNDQERKSNNIRNKQITPSLNLTTENQTTQENKIHDKSRRTSCEQWIHHTLPLIYIHMHSSETEHSSITITAWYPN